ncbi:MAG: sugar phosphate nucleotidyltransferase [Nanoarchaeota archaeon]|nr:sugar phosphate nucleotidyltransferase [Nanoarchaeota archaeon]
MKDKISITIEESVLKDIDSVVDNLFIRNRSQAIEHLVKEALGENKIAAILCGGSADELKISKTEYRPTAMVSGKSVIERAIRKLRDNGFRKIFIIARKDVLTAIFEILRDGSSYAIKIEYIEEKNAKGTADSLRLLKGKINTLFFVAYGDILFDNIDIEAIWHEQLVSKKVATLMLTTSAKPSTKGNVILEGNKILKFVQKPKKSEMYIVFSPLFAAEPQIFDYLGKSLEEDVFPKLAENGLLAGRISAEHEKHVHSKKDLT